MAKYKHKKSKMIINAVPYTNGQEDGFLCNVNSYNSCLDNEALYCADCPHGKPFIYATLGKIKQEVKVWDYIVKLQDRSKYIFKKEAMKNYRKVKG